MHPEIRKFYASSNREITHWGGGNLIDEVYFYHNDYTRNSICEIDPDVIAWGVGTEGKLKYKLNNEWHSEEEMLKLIKLKAFL